MSPQSVYPTLTHCPSHVPGKFACRILIQGIGFALPVTITVPVVLSLLVTFGALRNRDPCYFSGTIPDYLFFNPPEFHDLGEFFATEVRNHCLLQKMSYMQKPIINCVKRNQIDAQIILSIFRQLLHVSGVSRPIIRRHNRMYTTVGSYYTLYMTVFCPDWNGIIQTGQQTVW